MLRFPMYYPDPRVDRAEYRDWMGMTLADNEFKMNRDHMPVGLVVEWIRNETRRYGIILQDPNGGRLIAALFQNVRILWRA